MLMIDEEGEVYVVGCDYNDDYKYWLLQLPSTAWGATSPVPVRSYNIFDQEIQCYMNPSGGLYIHACGNNAMIICHDNDVWYWAVNGSDVAAALANPGISISSSHGLTSWSSDGSKYYSIYNYLEDNTNVYVYTLYVYMLV
jgi:hypothetical protein